MRLSSDLIKKWATIAGEGDFDEFLDFCEGMNITGATIENGERVLYFSNGMYYIGDFYRMGEHDGENEKYIIECINSAGFEFEN